jgi:hypothetical protein
MMDNFGFTFEFSQLAVFFFNSGVLELNGLQRDEAGSQLFSHFLGTKRISGQLKLSGTDAGGFNSCDPHFFLIFYNSPVKLILEPEFSFFSSFSVSSSARRLKTPYLAIMTGIALFRWCCS